MQQPTQCLNLETSAFQSNSQEIDEHQAREALSVALCWLQHAYCLSRYIASYKEFPESDAFATFVNEVMDLCAEAIDKFDELTGDD